MSSHEVLVVQVESIEPHPNADTLEKVNVSNYSYSILARKGDFVPGDLAVFVEPDYVVPTSKPEFEFLSDGGRKDKVRIAVKRLRGVWSEGLLFKAAPHHKLGDNVLEEYEIKRWEPPPPGTNKGWGNEGCAMQSGWQASPPGCRAPTYDLENERRYSKLVPEGTKVYYTVKIHGTNARFVFHDGQMYAGSRTTWKYKPGTKVLGVDYKTKEPLEREAPSNTWWTALEQHPWIEAWCRENPDCVVYGEIFGSVIQGNKFHYGYNEGKLGFRVFDVFENGTWVSFTDLSFKKKYRTLQLVPCAFMGPHDRGHLMTIAEEPESMIFFGDIGDHIREGIVIRPATEIYDERLGRVVLKYVSRTYLQKS